jgi:multidrug transporter EmrE-like cation transporter
MADKVSRLLSDPHSRKEKRDLRVPSIVGLTVSNLIFTVISNIGFKLSADSARWQHFLWWQVVGNLSGFLSVIAFTLLLRRISLHLAFAVTAGFGFALVQVLGARFIFHEPITSWQWFGVALITSGIFIVCLGR